MAQTPFGAQVLAIDSEPFTDLLYLSDIHIEGKAYRGGVPLLFPQFNTVGSL